MKIVRSITLLLMAGMIMIGMCGCMNQKTSENKISNIKEIVEQRYGEEFNVEYFLPAKDQTYDNILTLSNEDGVVFNAYQKRDDSVVSDNYLEALINQKLTNHIESSMKMSSDLKVRVLGIVKDGSLLTMDFVKNYIVSASNQDFVKIVTVVTVSDDILKHKEELYRIYNEVLGFNSNLVEFEVVSVREPGEELLKVLNNPLGYYNNNWDEFGEISKYIDVRTKDITSADELVKEIR